MAIKNKTQYWSSKLRVIDLTGPEGNVFVLMGYAKQYAKQLDLDGDKIKVQIMNQIEAYKLTLLKQKEDGDKQNSNTSKELSKKT